MVCAGTKLPGLGMLKATVYRRDVAVRASRRGGAVK